MGLVRLENITYQVGTKKLYNKATLRLNKGEHIALIGPNGCGKTTLFNIILKKIIPDDGIFDINQKIKIGYLDQHLDIKENISVSNYLKKAFEDLFNIETKINNLYEKIAIDYCEQDLLKALKYQEILDANDFDSIDKKIGNLINGLGIDIKNLDKNINSLSGGQKAKIMLAKLLLTDKDFYLLDEPTNFLDISQVEWLAKFLQNLDKAFILISHDIDFINKTCNIIYGVENLKLNRYVGNYEKYIKESKIKNEQYDKQYSSQQKQIEKLETYIAKNSARASTAKSAQSRVKQLEKIDVISKRQELIKPKFNFAYKKSNSHISLEIKNLTIGYSNCELVKNLNFTIKEGEKLIISGKNGVGKTTFLNTITSKIKPLNGEFIIGHNCRIEYFNQIEKIEPITAIVYMMRQFDDMTEQEIRKKLSQFGIKTNLMYQDMTTLSGGEQTKVRLASLSLKPCNILLLDEPTNHIDTLAKESLFEAIQKFPGTVLLTTHDINFSTSFANNILNFDKLMIKKSN